MLLNTKLNKILKIEFKSANKIRAGTGTVNLNKPIQYRELEPVQEPKLQNQNETDSVQNRYRNQN